MVDWNRNELSHLASALVQAVDPDHQEQIARQTQLRRTPRLDFQIDERLKKITETLNLLTEVTEELREKEQDTEPLQSSKTTKQ